MNTVSTGKAAGLLGIARQSVLRAIQRGDLEAEVTEGDGRVHYSIPLDALREYQRKREQKILSAPINDPEALPNVVDTTQQITAVIVGQNPDGTPITHRSAFQATELEPWREGKTRVWEKHPNDPRLKGDRFSPAAIVWTDSIELVDPGTVSTSPADGAPQALADTASGGQ